MRRTLAESRRATSEKLNKDVVSESGSAAVLFGSYKSGTTKPARSTKPSRKHVDKGDEKIMTDDAGAYNFRITKFHNAKHSKIRHSRGEYVKGEVHTNTVENSFSLSSARDRDVPPAFDKASTALSE